MHRRDLLRGVAASAVLPAVGGALAASAAPIGAARVRPGEAGWPDEAAWEGLKQAVGGRLVKPTYLFAPCETDPKSAACAALFKEAANPYYIGDQAGGTQVSGWLDAWSPKPSVWAVAANSTADVVAAVNFARRHNLRLVVKGGGHSYQGTSNAADSLLVWTRTMNDITLHDAFTPQGCEGLGPPVPAVSIGAGAMWADAYGAVTTKAGRYVQGGGCATVGVAGLIQSGGFGSFSKRYGLAAASLIEAEVVTADGVARVVNARRDPDLLWALKGGGGGSFGVVTRLTLKTHELGEIAGGFDLTIKAASDEAFHRLLRNFVALCPSFINPHWGESLHIRPSNQLSVSMVFQGLTGAEAKAVWKPLLDFAAASPGDFTVDGPSAAAQPMRGWWDYAADRAAHVPYEIFDERPGAPAQHGWWRGDADQVSMFIHGYESLWLPVSLLAPDQQARLADALFAASRHFSVALHFNKGLAGAPEAAIAAARNAATNPAVLDAFTLAIIATGGLPDYPGYPKPDLAGAKRDAERIDAATAVLRPLAPAGGSYISESNYFNDNWGAAFWGPHYAKLRAVKARYDPGGLFTVHHGVGSEAWSADGFTRVA
jgi:FAD/FMN-containing dehydrogenase